MVIKMNPKIDPTHCGAAACCEEPEIDDQLASQIIVLAGNPNVGKSVVFNALTGRYTQVSNFPGTTVDIPKGFLPDKRLLKDTPGVYGLSHFSEEEQVAESAILSADIVINIVSAVSLERDLFLTQQILDYQKPMLLVVNQIDEARTQGIIINLEQLENCLGIPVISAVAVTGEGLDLIIPTLNKARVGYTTPDCPPPDILKELEENKGEQIKLYGLRRHHVNAIVSQVLDKSGETNRPSLSKTLGTLFLNPLFGALSALLVMAILYQVVGIWIAGDLVNLIEKNIMLGYVTPTLSGVVSLVFVKGSILHTILAGEFGVLTMSVQYIFGVLFPLILGFYVYISVLEDCGYLPRVAVLCDGLLNKIGLNGRAVIPLILGFGCVTMAAVSTRVLTSQRERTIAATILAITIPCSAQLAVIFSLMALAGGLKGWLVFGTVMITILIALGSILNAMLPGKSSSLILDLPPIRLPVFKNIAQKTWIRTLSFIQEAAPLFIAGSLMVSIAQVTGLLSFLERVLAPITVDLLHLPQVAAQIFLMGMVRRDFGAAGLFLLADQLQPAQILTALVTIALFVPCIASFTVIWKERGIKESTLLLFGSWGVAFLVGAVVTRFIEWTHLL
jgi:ferrous iron transport protein B